MNIRKDRMHQSGLTNLDFKAKGDLNRADHFNPSMKFSDFGTMSRTQYKRVPSATTFKEQVALSGGWINSKYKNDYYKNKRFETAAQKYSENHKKIKAPVLIATKRATELEAA